MFDNSKIYNDVLEIGTKYEKNISFGYKYDNSLPVIDEKDSNFKPLDLTNLEKCYMDFRYHINDDSIFTLELGNGFEIIDPIKGFILLYIDVEKHKSIEKYTLNQDDTHITGDIMLLFSDNSHYNKMTISLKINRSNTELKI